MRRNNIFRLLLLFGVLSSIFCSCGTEISDPVIYQEYIYKNSTLHNLELTGYYKNYDSSSAVKTWSIEPIGTLVIELELIFGSVVPTPAYCDSVRLLFDGNRELWFRFGDSQPGNITQPGVAHEVRWNRTRYTHDITEAYYDRATEILLEN